MENNALKIQNKLYWLYLVGFFLIILQILNIIPPWFTPTDWGKAICFRIILSIVIFLFIWQVIYKKINFSEIKNKIKSVSLSLCLLFSFLGVYLLSTIFSLNPNFSLWGNPSRNGGFVNLAFYIIFSVLLFLIIRDRNWQKIWDFSIFIGIIVSIIAILQQVGAFSERLISIDFRPISTMGNPILLSIYLTLLTFLPLSFAIKEKKLYKKIFYYFSFALFLIINVFLTQTRGTMAGLVIGFIWFLFSYPKKLKTLKISLAIILLLSLFLIRYLDNHFYILNNQPYIIRSAIGRAISLIEGPKIMESRLSTWKVSLNALKERPILGYGPENFMIAFSKYYDPALPRLGYTLSEESVEWFDRAHNIVFDISVTAGILALLIYLAFFGALFWQLEKCKKRSSEISLISHGIQATILAYLGSLFFGFDSVSTFLSAFILIGYSFHLISNYSNPRIISEPHISSAHNETKSANIINFFYKYRTVFIILIFIFLLFFIWNYNIKPAEINIDINQANFYAENKRCDLALNLAEKINSSDTVMNNYFWLKGVGVIYNCSKDSKSPEPLTESSIKTLEKLIKANPQYVENWFTLGDYINILIEEKNKNTDNVFKNTPEMDKLKDDSNNYFQIALSLSPKRQLIYREWAKNKIVVGDYEKAKELSQKCIELNPYYPFCYWIMALTNGYQKNTNEFTKYLNLAQENGYKTDTKEALRQLANMYIAINDYKGLTEIYPKLISIEENALEKAQLYASLADSYKILGEIKKARETTLEILNLIPEMPLELQAGARADVEAFLKSLE